MRQKIAELQTHTANERRGSKRKLNGLSVAEFRKRVRLNHDSENVQRDMEMWTLARQRYHISIYLISLMRSGFPSLTSILRTCSKRNETGRHRWYMDKIYMPTSITPLIPSLEILSVHPVASSVTTSLAFNPSVSQTALSVFSASPTTPMFLMISPLAWTR